MSDLFRNKYRNQSVRCPNWDYASEAAYFITMCTAGKEHYFGEIVNGEMFLTEIGLTTGIEWLKTPSIRPDMNLFLDAFTIMPNHFHAIIYIGKNEYNSKSTIRENIYIDADYNSNADSKNSNSWDAMHRVPTKEEKEHSPNIVRKKHGLSMGEGVSGDPINDFYQILNEIKKRNYKNRFGPQSKNLSSIIRGFKSDITTYARKNDIIFKWQPNYYDHIIRDHQSHFIIRNYILNNIRNWNQNL